MNSNSESIEVGCPFCTTPMPAVFVFGTVPETVLCPTCRHPVTCGNGRAEPTLAMPAANTSAPWLAPPAIAPVVAPVRRSSSANAFPARAPIELSKEAASSGPLVLTSLADQITFASPRPQQLPAEVMLFNRRVGPPPQEKRRVPEARRSRRPMALAWAAVAVLLLAGAGWAIAGPARAMLTPNRHLEQSEIHVDDFSVNPGGTKATEAAPFIGPVAPRLVGARTNLN
jgi:hypothetical protein